MTDTNTNTKNQIRDLALFGGSAYFDVPKSTSSLHRPNFDNFLNYSKQFFNRQYYTNNGVLLRQLEERLAKFHEVQFCVGFCSGFWGLALAISSLALEGKREIIMPSLTYRRMADIAAWTRLIPHFCEVDSGTLALSRQTVRDAINNDTALILAVHPIVNCCDIEGIINLGMESGVPVLFDSVESMYESVGGRKVGCFGDAECFSMHASKLLNGFEGGYVTTNNAELAHRLALLRTYGFEGQDNCVLPGGINAKLNEVHAAMALANLDELDKLVAENHIRYMRYMSALGNFSSIRLLQFDATVRPSYKNIVVELLDDWPLSRDDTVSILNAENILARAYYSPPLHQKTMDYPYVPGDLLITDKLAKRFMHLPCGDMVTCSDIDNIVNLLRFIEQCGEEIAERLSEGSRE